jgi:RNA polymerase sigma-70 factor (sigma-E family)
VEEEFRQFVEARALALCRSAYLLTGDWQAGEDLVQEALTKTYARRRRLRDPAALEPYARKVLVSLFVTWRRRSWHRELPHAEVPDLGGADKFDQLADRGGMWSVLAALPPRQRAVLVLRYYEDLAEADIAAALHVSAGAVKTHAARGLDRLRRTGAVSKEWL